MRIISLAIGIILVLAAYFINVVSPYHYTPIFGYLIGGILIVVGLLAPSHQKMYERMQEKRDARGGGKGNSDSIAILKKRYANGEITKTQYDKMKKDLDS